MVAWLSFKFSAIVYNWVSRKRKYQYMVSKLIKIVCIEVYEREREREREREGYAFQTKSIAMVIYIYGKGIIFQALFTAWSE